MPKPKAKLKSKAVRVPRALEAKYLKALEEGGGEELVAAGRKVLADVRAGKKIRMPKGLPAKRAVSGPHLGALMVAPAAVGAAVCLASCIKLVNPWAIAGCVALCMGIGVPPV